MRGYLLKKEKPTKQCAAATFIRSTAFHHHIKQFIYYGTSVFILGAVGDTSPMIGHVSMSYLDFFYCCFLCVVVRQGQIDARR
jgi:hypothetical protein